MKLPGKARFDTICVHAGQEPEPTTGALIPPIFQTATYVQDALGRHKGYEYARTQNPTRATLEANITALEGGRAGFAFASGMAAIHFMLGFLRRQSLDVFVLYRFLIAAVVLIVWLSR